MIIVTEDNLSGPHTQKPFKLTWKEGFNVRSSSDVISFQKTFEGKENNLVAPALACDHLTSFTGQYTVRKPQMTSMSLINNHARCYCNNHQSAIIGIQSP